MVIKPISVLSTLGMLLLWKLPSRMTGHLTVLPMPKLLASSRLAQVILKLWELVESLPAEALPTARARMVVAVRLMMSDRV
jgi:hypothetical protein